MNAAVGITKGSPLPGDHHVLRYVGGGLVDRETNRVHGSAFLPRRGEDDPSVNWLEYFSPPLDNQIRSIARDKRLKWGKTARLIRLNIGETIRTVTEVTDAQVVLSVFTIHWRPMHRAALVPIPPMLASQDFPPSRPRTWSEKRHCWQSASRSEISPS